jgi:hypothetical protein
MIPVPLLHTWRVKEEEFPLLLHKLHHTFSIRKHKQPRTDMVTLIPSIVDSRLKSQAQHIRILIWLILVIILALNITAQIKIKEHSIHKLGQKFKHF